MFRALVLHENAGRVQTSIEELPETRLPEGDVDIAIEYSSLNYKDGMILKGLGRLVRQYPHVSDVDLAGTVMESRHPAFRPGDSVVLTGWAEPPRLADEILMGRVHRRVVVDVSA